VDAENRAVVPDELLPPVAPSARSHASPSKIAQRRHLCGGGSADAATRRQRAHHGAGGLWSSATS